MRAKIIRFILIMAAAALLWLVVAAATLLWLTQLSPKATVPMPPEGERHVWRITWLNTNGAVLVTEPYPGEKIPQVFYNDTAYPRRTWGTNCHRVNGVLQLSGVDPADGTKWVAELIN